MLRVVLLISAVALAGCDVGEVDIGGGGVDASLNSPKAMAFESTIKPLAQIKGCMTATTCHAIQAPILTSFGALAAKYTSGPGATNVLVTKDTLPPAPTPGFHSGIPYFSAAEKMTVTTWIDTP